MMSCIYYYSQKLHVLYLHVVNIKSKDVCSLAEMIIA